MPPNTSHPAHFLKLFQTQGTRRLRDPEIGAEARRRRDHGRRDGRPAADLERDARDGAAAAPADRGCDEVGRCARLPARAIRTGIGRWSKSLSYQRSAAPRRIVWPKRGGGSGRAMPRRRGSGGRDRHGARSAPPVVPAGVASDDEAVKLSRPAFGGWPILETPGAVSARAGIGRLPGSLWRLLMLEREPGITQRIVLRRLGASASSYPIVLAVRAGRLQLGRRNRRTGHPRKTNVRSIAVEFADGYNDDESSIYQRYSEACRGVRPEHDSSLRATNPCQDCGALHAGRRSR